MVGVRGNDRFDQADDRCEELNVRMVAASGALRFRGGDQERIEPLTELRMEVDGPPGGDEAFDRCLFSPARVGAVSVDDAVSPVQQRLRVHQLLGMGEGVFRKVLEEHGELRLVLDGPPCIGPRHNDPAIGVVENCVLGDAMSLEPGVRDHCGARAAATMKLDALTLFHAGSIAICSYAVPIRTQVSTRDPPLRGYAASPSSTRVSCSAT